MDYNSPGYSVHGILLARILESVAIPSPGDLLSLGIKPTSPAWQARFFITEPPGKQGAFISSLLSSEVGEVEGSTAPLPPHFINVRCYSPVPTWKVFIFKAIKNGFLGSNITLDDDCSHEINRHLLLGRKAMTNLNSELKSRDVILQMKVCIVKAMVFPLVMDRCESWTIKKAEH